MAPRIPDKKCHGLQNSKYFWCVTNVAGSHLGPVTPSAADGASFGAVFEQSWASHTRDLRFESRNRQIFLYTEDNN